MGTTDGFACFKRLHHFPNVALVVSKTDKLEAGKVYEAPAGWRWGGKTEVTAIMGGGKEERRPRKDYYYGQVGWVGDTWGGVCRVIFIFSDSLQVGGCLNAGGTEGRIYEGIDAVAAELGQTLQQKWFAGIVCVAD